MNHLLKSKANVCKTRGRILGYEADVVDCQDDLVLIINRKSEKVAAIGLRESEGEVIFESFVIDVRKWMWAESEGFTMEQMVDPDGDVRSLIFKKTPFDRIPKMLV